MALTDLVQDAFTAVADAVRNTFTMGRVSVGAASLLAVSACAAPSNEDNNNDLGIRHGNPTEQVDLRKDQITGPEGRVQFVDMNGEIVTIYVKNEQDLPLQNVTVTYHEEAGFKAFQLDHNDFAPQMEIASHNSDHTYWMTPAPLQVIHYDQSGRERSEAAAQNFSNWHRWEDDGCRTREELDTLVDGGTIFIKRPIFLGYFSQWLDELVDRAKEELRPDQTARVHSIRPRDQGFYATTSLMMLDLTDDNGCYPEQECHPFERFCEDGDVYKRNNCVPRIFVQDCTPEQYCEEGICIDRSVSEGEGEGPSEGEGEERCRELERFCNEFGDVYQRDSCGEETRIQDCTVDQYCDNAVCVDRAPNEGEGEVDDCDLISDCNAPNCIFYDDFSGNELDTECRWLPRHEDRIRLSQGNIELRTESDFPRPDYTSVTSLSPDYFDEGCQDNFEVEARVQLTSERTEFRMRFGSAASFVINLPNLLYHSLSTACGDAWIDKEGLDLDVEMWNTFTLRKQGGAISLRINGEEYGVRQQRCVNFNTDNVALNCGSLSPFEDQSCNVDYLQVTCDF
jgi:hypothetical protein